MCVVLAFLLPFFFFALVDSEAQLESLGNFDDFDTFDNVEPYPDITSGIFDLGSEPIWMWTDESTNGLGLDPDLVGIEVNELCFLDDAQSMNDVQKRNNACSPRLEVPEKPKTDSSLDQQNTPILQEWGRMPTTALTSDDADICQDTGYFAVCDSGNDDDRILNQVTGEHSLFRCERREQQVLLNPLH
jgi:hypothetical protein